MVAAKRKKQAGSTIEIFTCTAVVYLLVYMWWLLPFWFDLGDPVPTPESKANPPPEAGVTPPPVTPASKIKRRHTSKSNLDNAQIEKEKEVEAPKEKVRTAVKAAPKRPRKETAAKNDDDSKKGDEKTPPGSSKDGDEKTPPGSSKDKAEQEKKETPKTTRKGSSRKTKKEAPTPETTEVESALRRSSTTKTEGETPGEENTGDDKSGNESASDDDAAVESQNESETPEIEKTEPEKKKRQRLRKPKTDQEKALHARYMRFSRSLTSQDPRDVHIMSAQCSNFDLVEFSLSLFPSAC